MAAVTKMSNKRSTVFASVTAPSEISPPRKIKEQCDDANPIKLPSNEIHVSATGEMSLAPERCKIVITVSSTKEHAQEAKNSVQRRLDYVLQTLHNHQVKEGDIRVTKALERIDGLYHLDAEVSAHFVDFNNCQALSNFLVEKLDETVRVSPPEFYHGPQTLENLRRQTSLIAIKNAKQKAAEIAQLLRARVGSVITIREESVKEWEGSADGLHDMDSVTTMQHRITQATVHVCVKVSATFELKPLKVLKAKEKN